jgi:hypothetical protein
MAGTPTVQSRACASLPSSCSHALGSTAWAKLRQPHLRQQDAHRRVRLGNNKLRTHLTLAPETKHRVISCQFRFHHQISNLECGYDGRVPRCGAVVDAVVRCPLSDGSLLHVHMVVHRENTKTFQARPKPCVLGEYKFRPRNLQLSARPAPLHTFWKIPKSRGS